MHLRALIVVLAVSLTGACDGDDDADGSGGTTSAPCDGAGETYSAGMSKPGSAGKLTFTLLDSKPAPPGVNDNVWTVAISDGAGAPVVGASVLVKTWMPEHGHSSSAQAVVSEPEGGKYLLDPVNLMMPGLWEVTIEAKPTSGESDSALFAFCIGE
jgi:hypothetical protein